MLNAMKSALVGGIVGVAGITTMPGFAAAADLTVLAPAHHAVRWCGPCGCLHVSYVRHRELRTTYGIGFDPRNYDETEPHHYFGPMRAYPRYWVAANPVY